jgi:hypothetical protein
MTMNIDRFDLYLAEGRLIRDQWTGNDAEGRATACWLAALFDEAASSENTASCPSDQLPQWFAYLIPWMDDQGTEEQWLVFAERISAVLRAPRTVDQWHRAEYAVRALCVREAMRHTDDASVLEVCENVASLCDVVFSGEPRDNKAFRDSELSAIKSAAEYGAAAAQLPLAAAAASSRGASHVAKAAAWASDANPGFADSIIDGILTVLEQQQLT